MKLVSKHGITHQTPCDSVFLVPEEMFGMTGRTDLVSGSTSSTRPDPQYAFVGGLYLAALLTPVTVLVLATVFTDAALLYLGFLAIWTVITALAGWCISQIGGIAVRLGGSDGSWALMVFPFMVFIGAFVALSSNSSLPRIAVPLAMITMITGVLFGMSFVLMSQNRHAEAVLADATEFTQWEARWPLQWRQFSVGAMILAFGSLLVAIIAQIGFDADWASYFYLVAFLWTPLAGTATPRTFRVTDAGLVVERSLHHRARPWSAFEKYVLTDDALILVSNKWWRPKLRCDRGDISDVDAVVSALDKTPL